MQITILGDPRTKKNSQRIVHVGTQKKRTLILPSAAYTKYEKASIPQLVKQAKACIDQPINLQCVYYMQTRRKVDLANLLEGTCDVLVHAGVLADDHCGIIVSHDGSRVLYDKENPRVEITITTQSIWEAVGMNNNYIPFYNPSGYKDPTAHDGLVAAMGGEDETDLRAARLIKIIRKACHLAEFDLVGRVHIRDRQTGREYR